MWNAGEIRGSKLPTALLTVIALIVGLLTLVSAFPPDVTAANSFAPSTLAETSGDVDCNADLGNADAQQLLEHFVANTEGAYSCGANNALGPNLSRADIDLDDTASLRDALVVAQCVAAISVRDCPPLPTIDPDAGDVNCDQKLDEADASAIEATRLGQPITTSQCDSNDPSQIDIGRGDLTADGTLDSADAWLARACIRAHQEPELLHITDRCPRTGTETVVAMGDVNCDGSIDEQDVEDTDTYLTAPASGALSCFGGAGATINLARADINGDGRVSASDSERLTICLANFDRTQCPSSVRPAEPVLPLPDYDSPLMGDANCDGIFDRNDAIAAAELATFGTASTLACDFSAQTSLNAPRADVNRDGVITFDDAGILSECAAGVNLDNCPIARQIEASEGFDVTSPAIGDTNCDGHRDSADVAAILAMLAPDAERTDRCQLGVADQRNFNRADLNRDGFVTPADAILLSRCLVTPTDPACPAISCGSADVDPTICVHDQRIFSIRFLPRDPEDPTMLDPWALTDSEAADDTRLLIDDLFDNIENSEMAALPLIAGASRYKGWANPSAPPSIELTIVDELTLYERPPIGLPYRATFRPDYQQILTRPDVNICNLVDNQGIDEVWMWSMHTERIEPVESNMASRSSLPFIDISNSEGTNDLPHCSRTYVLYNFNFRADEANMLHNRGHHMESLLKWLWSDRQVFNYDGYVGEGAFYEQLVAPQGFYRCGNVHRSVNSPAKELPGEPEENNWVQRTVQSDCKDWERTGGVVSDIDCDDWFQSYWGEPECFDDGGMSWVTWWFQNLPGMANGLVDEGRQWRNVHDAIGDPDQLLMSESFLFETERRRAPGQQGNRLGVDRHHVTHELD